MRDNYEFQQIYAMNYERDGFMEPWDNQDGAPNYYPNSFNGPDVNRSVQTPSYYLSGTVDRHTPIKEDDFGQPAVFWQRVLDDGAKARLVENFADSLKNASNFIVERQISNFMKVNVDLGKRVTDALRKKGKMISEFGKLSNL